LGNEGKKKRMTKLQEMEKSQPKQKKDNENEE
jgi:hypothetical protein